MKMSNEQKSALAVELSELGFAWRDDLDPVLAIEQLRIERGERVFIEGPSVSGKSTLLSLIAGVIIPQQGTITINGVHLNALSGAERDRFRADHIGFIYQMFNLIPYLSVIENVTLPCRFSAQRRQSAASRASDEKAAALKLLSQLGMDGAAVVGQPVTQLSVGQQQRVAAARALIGAPDLVIADEPTSSLDADRREAFIQLLFDECRRQSTTLIFVSHDRAFESLFHRTIRLEDINAV